MKLGKIGVWAGLDAATSPQIAAFAQQVEAAGFSALWYPEAVGRNSLVCASWLLASTRSLVVATGIANIYARDAMAMAAARAGLNEQSGGRFLLGLGVSHAPLVDDVRGHAYGKPVATMRAYLDGMDRATYVAPPPAEAPRTVLAALGPQMLALARDRADGAHPYNVTPAFTAQARAALGPGKLLCVEQKVLAETDPVAARRISREALKIYMGFPNYLNNWRRMGLTDADFAGDGSDALIDAMVAWGSDAQIVACVQAHLAAGADHVCIQLLGEGALPDMQVLTRLARLLA